MTNKEPNEEITVGLKTFMDYHHVESIQELIAIADEDLFRMEGITMHMMLEIYKIRDKV